jgi:hypothetical protein
MGGGSYLIFGDIEGKLDGLRVECTKYARKARYSISRLIGKYGRKGNMMKWKEQLNVSQGVMRSARALRFDVCRPTMAGSANSFVAGGLARGGAATIRPNWSNSERPDPPSDARQKKAPSVCGASRS